MLTVTKVVLGVVVLAAAVSPSMVLLTGSGVSTVVSDCGSVPLAPDTVSADVMVLVKSDSDSVESSKADTSEVDRAFPPVGS